jgi:outer membrane protein OmpA-like peptidoglycan-associated protein
MKIKQESSWISFTDLMTALMVIFMFIAISYIMEVDKDKKKIELILEEYQKNKINLYNDLKSEFENDFKDWEVILNNDLSVQFTNPDILFDSGDKYLTKKFEDILGDFIPRYFNILLSPKYENKISEIRIEGHTDKVRAPKYDKDSYISNVKLSQARATEVLKNFKFSDYYKNLDIKTKEELQFMLTANGLSFGRMLDSNKELVKFSKNKPNRKFSRRVEFKIIPKTEEAVYKVLNELKK